MFFIETVCIAAMHLLCKCGAQDTVHVPKTQILNFRFHSFEAWFKLAHLNMINSINLWKDDLTFDVLLKMPKSKQKQMTHKRICQNYALNTLIDWWIVLRRKCASWNNYNKIKCRTSLRSSCDSRFALLKYNSSKFVLAVTVRPAMPGPVWNCSMSSVVYSWSLTVWVESHVNY